jgi:bla regulator protein blaR1
MLMLGLRNRSSSWNYLHSLIFLAAFVSAIAVSSVSSNAQSQSALPPASPSQSAPEWQRAAGGKMEFDAASIKLSLPGTQPHANFGLNIDNETLQPGGLLSASNRPLTVYIEFAYKIMLTREQEASMVAHRPKWVAEQGFDFEARAEDSPTKDQARLMMQSLLADRFKLAVHFETRDTPVLVMVLDKPGKLGPRIRPHSEGPSCDTKLEIPSDRSSPSVPPGGFLPFCRAVVMIPGPDHTLLLGARDVDMEHIASYLPLLESEGRPVVDRTGLTGTFDFSINWAPASPASASSATDTPLDNSGPTFEEGLREQLGLKLKPARAPIRTLVIDHVEEPSPN